MGDALLAALVVLVVVVVALLALGGTTVVPFVVGVNMAERRHFDLARWGTFTLLSSLVALACAYLVVESDLPDLLAIVPVVATWTGPGVLWLLEEGNVRVGGRAGRHQ